MTPKTITREQFELVRPLLEDLRKRTRPRTNDLYDIFSAILYRHSTRCSWRQLPRYFPAWRSVHQYWLTWSSVPGADGAPVLQIAFARLGLS